MSFLALVALLVAAALGTGFLGGEPGSEVGQAKQARQAAPEPRLDASAPAAASAA